MVCMTKFYLKVKKILFVCSASWATANLFNSLRGKSLSYHTVTFDMASKYQKIITTVIDNSGTTYATILHNYVLHRVITITIG